MPPLRDSHPTTFCATGGEDFQDGRRGSIVQGSLRGEDLAAGQRGMLLDADAPAFVPGQIWTPPPPGLETRHVPRARERRKAKMRAHATAALALSVHLSSNRVAVPYDDFDSTDCSLVSSSSRNRARPLRARERRKLSARGLKAMQEYVASTKVRTPSWNSCDDDSSERSLPVVACAPRQHLLSNTVRSQPASQSATHKHRLRAACAARGHLGRSIQVAPPGLGSYPASSSQQQQPPPLQHRPSWCEELRLFVEDVS